MNGLVFVDSSYTVVINAANLKVGGGVQVASALFTDIIRLMQSDSSNLPRWFSGLQLIGSPAVQANILPELSSSNEGVQLLRDRRTGAVADVEFTVFGPVYRKPRARAHVCGFADVTSVYPPPPLAQRSQWPPRWLRKRISLRSFRRCDIIVVETAAVKSRLIEIGFAASSVRVVPNSYHPIFKNRSSNELWEPRETPNLLYVARGYRHKNHDFLGEVGARLEQDYGQTVRFIVTLTESEWSQRSDLFRRHCDNIGPVNVAELPDIYRTVDACIFPSLLECFSATPLEALKMGVPLVAADRDFVRTVVGEGASYFDPLDPLDAARVIVDLFKNKDRTRRMIQEGKRIALQSPTSMDRTDSYIRIIDGLL